MKRYSRKLSMLLLVTGLLVFMMTPAWAATSADKQAAIDKGLAYLANDQQANGSWVNGYGGGSYAAATTAAALLAFVDQKYKPLGWNGQDYSAVVNKGFDYLLSQASTVSFNGGNWWGFGVGKSGIQWYNNGEMTYATGLATPALSRLVSNPYGGAPLVAPSTVINSSNAAVNGLTYAQVIQKTVDTWTYYQTGPAYGDRYGGWRYYVGNVDSDMSTTQWAPISYLFAKQVPGVQVPDKVGNAYDPSANVATGIKAWLTADQYSSGPNKGGVDYQPGYSIINATHIGGFLVSNYFAGGGGNGGNGKADAIAWLNAHWPGFTANSNWTGYNNEGNPYAMWAVYKGLETLYGTTGPGPISNLNPQTTAIDPGATWNWWEDYCQYLVNTQNGNGGWSGADYWTGDLATAWDINILNATQTGGGTVPLPTAVWFLGSGLVGLVGIRRKLRK